MSPSSPPSRASSRTLAAARPPRTSGSRRARSIGFAVIGWFLGYLLSVVSSVVFFQLTGIEPTVDSSPGPIAVTAAFGIAASLLAGFAGASVERTRAIGIGLAIGITIAIVAAVFWVASPLEAHWSYIIALVANAPAAWVGAWLRRVK